ncbi:beta-lactamase class A [Variovorax boronicumulans]|uniref:Beta-lactamase n=1 Tax=Variovorax boronicumulans TaxID=436515 RepID=A0AAW8DVZ6_9BURK|nr:class A beta-lactamase [Variovorax boronicumulans]MDP9878412.1 beta-lactamase class A [Variovorax boronicumulans]MDP9923584.1 beta-lactamase class A [Variovorax boronicumulans]PBI93993.1 Beta-lactamase [Variovorax boronicumulans]
MNPLIQRRTLLLAAAVTPLAGACSAWPKKGAQSDAETQLAELERTCGGRLGVSGFHTGSGARLQHRAHERFPLCSTFKLVLAAAVLERSTTDASLLGRRVSVGKGDLVSHSPVAEKHLATGMTVNEMCAATMQYSDNAAANLLLKVLGGPAAVTAFARRIGDTTFRLDRTEPELNTAIPGDPRDTTTPAAMSDTVQRLALGDALGAPQREQMREWLLGNTTSTERFLAGVPKGWRVGDKTGAGSYGSTNDVGVLWPPSGAPLVLSVYLTFPDKDAKNRNDVVAEATRIAVKALAG